MEKKKLTRDQHLIRLIRENEEKDVLIKDLEKDKKDHAKRLKKLEEQMKRIMASVALGDKAVRVLKEKTSSHEHDLTTVKRTLSRK